VDPTPSEFRRKWGTDRHHLPRRHPEPCLPLGSHGLDPPTPGAKRSVWPKRGNKKTRCLPPWKGPAGVFPAVLIELGVALVVLLLYRLF
jgi:hypothetical protein